MDGRNQAPRRHAGQQPCAGAAFPARRAVPVRLAERRTGWRPAMLNSLAPDGERRTAEEGHRLPARRLDVRPAVLGQSVGADRRHRTSGSSASGRPPARSGDLCAADRAARRRSRRHRQRAAAIVLAHPERNYVDATDPGYSVYKAAARSGGRSVVVAPANDGMVHVFNAGPMPTLAAPAVLPGGGTELFAFHSARHCSAASRERPQRRTSTAIQALTYQDGGVPIYHHHMYVDSSPRVADVDFGNGSRPTGTRSSSAASARAATAITRST